MEFQIPSNSIKSPEAYFSVSQDQLELISYNESKSAYISFKFASWFFETYFVSNKSSSSQNNVISFKVNFKPLLGVFRLRGNSPDKAIQKCVVKLDDPNFRLNEQYNDTNNREADAECRMVVEIHQKAGVVRTYKLTYEAVETLQPIYDKNRCVNRFVIDPKLLKDNIGYFSKQLDEISLCMTERHILIRSWSSGSLSDTHTDLQSNGIHTGIRDYVETSRSLAGDANRDMQTELYMEAEEFEHYQLTLRPETQSQSQLIDQVYPEFTELSFALRDLKTVVQYAESASAFIQAFFDNGGDPIIFVVSDELPLSGSSKKRKKSDKTSSNTNASNDLSNKSMVIEGVVAEFVIATVPELGSSSQYHTQNTIKAIQKMRNMYSETQPVLHSQDLYDYTNEADKDLDDGNESMYNYANKEIESHNIQPNRKLDKDPGAGTENVTHKANINQEFLVPSNKSNYKSHGNEKENEQGPGSKYEFAQQNNENRNDGLNSIPKKIFSSLHMNASISSDTESMNASVGKMYNSGAARNSQYQEHPVNSIEVKIKNTKINDGLEDNRQQRNNFSQSTPSRLAALGESDSMLQTPLSGNVSLHAEDYNSVQSSEMGNGIQKNVGVHKQPEEANSSREALVGGTLKNGAMNFINKSILIPLNSNSGNISERKNNANLVENTVLQHYRPEIKSVDKAEFNDSNIQVGKQDNTTKDINSEGKNPELCATSNDDINFRLNQQLDKILEQSNDSSVYSSDEVSDSGDEISATPPSYKQSKSLF
ncbi:hypothetical protein BB561_005924 [Smittium simulii]|uniref:DNA repair protein rad9 n=1 Tax=Smittium simulii TaxID=133385 RepID=A0A2T9Y7K1_9FUNG|nr:hypothetical protein BB561_005924 [Smittium simulii]